MHAHSTSPTIEFLWRASGVDREILLDKDCPESERVRFAAFGLLLVVGTAVNFASGFLLAGFVLFPVTFSAGSFISGFGKFIGSAFFAALWSAFMLNLFRLTIGLAGRQTDRITFSVSDIFRVVLIGILTFSLAMATACPLQVILSERGSKTEALGLSQIQALETARHADNRAIDALASPLANLPVAEDEKSVKTLPAECSSVTACRDYYNRTTVTSASSGTSARTPEADLAVASAQVMQDRFDRLSHSYAYDGFFSRVFLAYDSNPLFSWTIFLSTWVLLALAPAIRMFTDRGPYDFLVDQRRRRWLSAHGIEVDAQTIFSKSGKPIHLTAFHSARRLLRQTQAEIYSNLKSKLDEQTNTLRREFSRISLSGGSSVEVWIKVRKRVVAVQVNFVEESVNVETLEGVVVANRGDAVITAHSGESWPVARAIFEQRYVPSSEVIFGQAGTYLSRPAVALALRLQRTFSIKLSDGRSTLTGQAGDWLLDYGNGNQGVVAADIFAETYEVLGDDALHSVGFKI